MWMTSSVWEWWVDLVEKKTEDMKKYFREWFLAHKDDPEFRRRKQEAVERYNARRMAEDPEEFLEYRREIVRKSTQKWYAKKMENITPEELEAIRKRKREWAARNRAKKKAEKLAQEQANKEKEGPV